jgi:hypothetical protein
MAAQKLTILSKTDSQETEVHETLTIRAFNG